MSYDQWKTTDPREYEPEEPEPVSELEEVCDQLRDAQADAKKYREALAGLYGLIKLIYVGADPADEIRRVLATNHRSIAAADALGVDRVDDPKF